MSIHTSEELTLPSSTGAMPNHEAQSICAIIVTYGSRHPLCLRVIEAVLGSGADHVIVVDNDSEPDSRRALASAAQANPDRITLLSLSTNRGSSGGYEAGLRATQRRDECAFIWLLDDDNLPAPNALAALRRAYASLPRATQETAAVVSRRAGHPWYDALANGTPETTVFPRNTFMHFSILAAPRKLLARHFKRPREPMTSDPAGLILIPFGPYGGLFFHRSLLEVIGYPDTRMFVYSDDTEYTQRITRSGGSLFFVGSSVIHDIDTSWSLAAKGGNGLTRLLFADSDMRTYYATRNRVFFERYHWRASRALYYVNRTIYLTVLRATALMFRRRDRLRLLTRALSEGEAADFGGTERGHSR